MAKIFAMLEIDAGETRPIPISLSYLSPNRTILIIDEETENIYLFIGRDVGLVARKTAERIAQSIKTYGIKIGNMIVGRNCRNTIIIDQGELGESFKEIYQNLINKIELWEPVNKSAVDLEKEKPKPAKKVEAVVEVEKPAIAEAVEKRKLEVEEAKPIEHHVSAKIGFVVLKLLDQFPEIFIGKTSRKDVTIIRFEGPQGNLGEIVVSGNQVEIKPSKEFEAEFKKIMREVEKEHVNYFT